MKTKKNNKPRIEEISHDQYNLMKILRDNESEVFEVSDEKEYKEVLIDLFDKKYILRRKVRGKNEHRYVLSVKGDTFLEKIDKHEQVKKESVTADFLINKKNENTN